MYRAGAYEVQNLSGKGVRWWGRCEWCTQNRWLYDAHIFPVGSYPRARYFPRNAFALCYHCHINRWHKHPVAARRFAVSMLGVVGLDELEQRVKAAPKVEFIVALVVLKLELQWLRHGGRDAGSLR